MRENQKFSEAVEPLVSSRSREAAKECSPRRKAWVADIERKQAPKGRKIRSHAHSSPEVRDPRLSANCQVVFDTDAIMTSRSCSPLWLYVLFVSMLWAHFTGVSLAQNKSKQLSPTGLSFAPVVNYDSGEFGAYSVVIADMNQDGKPDLIVANGGGSTNCPNGCVGVLLGNGNGTFKNAITYGSGGSNAVSIAVADVNDDGKPDIVVLNFCAAIASCAHGSVGILLGNGDGTFQPVVTCCLVGYQSGSLAVADVNGDGRPDLVVANSWQCIGCYNGGISVLLGNGDGTFGPAITYGSGGYIARFVGVADVNRDGEPDILVANCGVGASCYLPFDGSVGVLINNGDGTFQTAVAYDSGGPYANSLAVADVIGEGNPSVFVANGCSVEGCAASTNNTVGVFLGNGSGIFQKSVTYGSGGQNTSSLAVSDVSEDGRPDIVVANQNAANANNVGVLLGNGDGTFQSVVSFSSGGYFAHSIARRNRCASVPTGTITFLDGTTSLGSVPLTNGTASLSTTSLSASTHIITASYSPNTNIFTGSISSPVDQIVNLAATTTSLVSSVNPIQPNQSVTYTATISSPYGGPTTGTITFKDGKTSKIVPVNGKSALWTTTYSTTGTHSISATYSGDSNNAGSTSGTLTEYVENFPVGSKTVVTTSGSPSLINQLVMFTATVSSIYGQIPNGESVTFWDGTTQIGAGTITSGVATDTTSTLSAKTHTIKATYAGDATFKSSSGTVKQIVNLYSTTTSLSSTPNPSKQGQSVMLTAQVTSTGSTTPTGNVLFKNGTTTLGTATLNGKGVATLTTTTLPVGQDSLTAAYSGNALNAGSTSAPLIQTVN